MQIFGGLTSASDILTYKDWYIIDTKHSLSRLSDRCDEKIDTNKAKKTILKFIKKFLDYAENTNLAVGRKQGDNLYWVYNTKRVKVGNKFLMFGLVLELIEEPEKINNEWKDVKKCKIITAIIKTTPKNLIPEKIKKEVRVELANVTKVYSQYKDKLITINYKTKEVHQYDAIEVIFTCDGIKGQ